MEVKIPIWAEEVKDENWIVFFWFLRSLTICYPPYGRKEDRKELLKRRRRPEAIYGMLPKDVHTILGTRALLHQTIESWPNVAKNFTLGNISNETTRCTMKTWALSHTVELKERRTVPKEKRFLEKIKEVIRILKRNIIDILILKIKLLKYM